MCYLLILLVRQVQCCQVCPGCQVRKAIANKKTPVGVVTSSLTSWDTMSYKAVLRSQAVDREYWCTLPEPDPTTNIYGAVRGECYPCEFVSSPTWSAIPVNVDCCRCEVPSCEQSVLVILLSLLCPTIILKTVRRDIMTILGQCPGNLHRGRIRNCVVVFATYPKLWTKSIDCFQD